MDKHPVFNVHTHIFNFDCVPDGFLSNRMSRTLARVLAWGLRNSRKFTIVAKFLTKKLFRKYATFLAVGTQRRPLDVFTEMMQSYHQENARFVVLPMNFDYMGGGTAPADNITQLQMVIDVRTQYPDTCLPFLSVDPRQGTAEQILEYVEKYIGPNKPFVGIKLYPSLGFYPSDPRLEKMYEYAQRNSIPILTHCTREGAFYAGKRVPVELLQYSSFNLTTAVKQRQLTTMYTKVDPRNPEIACDNFLDPVNYIDVLEKFKGLKLCFAHFGGETEMRMVYDHQGNRKVGQGKLTKATVDAGLSPDVSWFRIVEYLLMNTDYPNVYTDISFTLYDDQLFMGLANILKTEPYNDRVLFGTDYFMTTQHKTEFNLYDEFRTALKDPAVWKLIAYTNPRNFLKSNFYHPK